MAVSRSYEREEYSVQGKIVRHEEGAVRGMVMRMRGGGCFMGLEDSRPRMEKVWWKGRH